MFHIEEYHLLSGLFAKNSWGELINISQPALRFCRNWSLRHGFVFVHLFWFAGGMHGWHVKMLNIAGSWPIPLVLG